MNDEEFNNAVKEIEEAMPSYVNRMPAEVIKKISAIYYSDAIPTAGINDDGEIIINPVWMQKLSHEARFAILGMHEPAHIDPAVMWNKEKVPVGRQKIRNMLSDICIHRHFANKMEYTSLLNDSFEDVKTSIDDPDARKKAPKLDYLQRKYVFLGRTDGCTIDPTDRKKLDTIIERAISGVLSQNNACKKLIALLDDELPPENGGDGEGGDGEGGDGESEGGDTGEDKKAEGKENQKMPKGGERRKTKKPTGKITPFDEGKINIALKISGSRSYGFEKGKRILSILNMKKAVAPLILKSLSSDKSKKQKRTDLQTYGQVLRLPLMEQERIDHLGGWKDHRIIEEVPEETKKTSLIFIRDSSGSMCDDDISISMAVIDAVSQINKIEKIVLIEFTSDVEEVAEFRKIDEALVRFMERRYTGGTCMESAFERSKDVIKESKEKIGNIVVLSDFCINGDDVRKCIKIAKDLKDCEIVLIPTTDYYKNQGWEIIKPKIIESRKILREK